MTSRGPWSEKKGGNGIGFLAVADRGTGREKKQEGDVPTAESRGRVPDSRNVLRSQEEGEKMEMLSKGKWGG